MKIVALASAACLSACGARTGLLAIESTRDAAIGPVDAGSEAPLSLEASAQVGCQSWHRIFTLEGSVTGLQLDKRS